MWSRSLSGRETGSRKGHLLLFQAPASPTLPSSSLQSGRSQHFIFPVSLGGECCHAARSWESADGFFLGKNFLSYKEEKARMGKGMPTGLPCFLPLNTCEADGWSASQPNCHKEAKKSTGEDDRTGGGCRASGLADILEPPAPPWTSVLQLPDEQVVTVHGSCGIPPRGLNHLHLGLVTCS